MMRSRHAIRRLTAFAGALLLALQLSGCGLNVLPFPTASTGETTAVPASSAAESTEASASAAVPETTPAETAARETPAESTVPETSPQETPTESSAETAPESSAEASSGEASSEAPTQESTAPEPAFVLDYYRTPDILRAVASDAVLVDAYNLINAFLAGKTSVIVSSPKEETGRILYVADTLCPLLKAFSDVSEDSWLAGTLSWRFYVDKVEMSVIRAEFERQVAAYIEPLYAEDYSETERALLLYHAYTAPASYNYSIISGVFNTYTEAEKHRAHSAYAGIMDHTGVCHDLAGGMTFLFIQAGFNAGRVSVITADDEHSWTLIELNGKYTYCDATWDVGGYFSFFGNSAEGRTTKRGGEFSLADMDLYDLNAPENFDIVDPGFAAVQDYSYSRFVRSTPLTLKIDLSATPHRLTFSTGLLFDSITVDCP